MKVSKVRIILWIIVGFLMTLGIVGGVLSKSGFFSDTCFGTDLRLRRNEICCAHQGINSFRIWNHDVSLAGFTPMTRPDRPKLARKDDDKVVHAYPAWHTAFFYFYGWLPELMCISLMSVIFGVCAKYIFDEILSTACVITNHKVTVAGMVLAMICFPFTQCFFLLNYGVLLTALFLLLRKLINDNKQFCAGLCWAVMMIKPQVGILLFWPLFWGKRYVTIFVAIVTCVCASCVTALCVNENVMSLILQVPEIGKPYGGYIVVDSILKPIVGDMASWLWMVGIFVLCGILSYWTRGVKDLFVSAAPLVAFIPIWTYSQGHDHVILLCWYFSTLICALTSKWWRLYWGALIFVMIFTHSWSLLCGCGIFDPTGRGWIYRIFSLGFDMVTIFAAIAYSWQIHKRKIRIPILAPQSCMVKVNEK